MTFQTIIHVSGGDHFYRLLSPSGDIHGLQKLRESDAMVQNGSHIYSINDYVLGCLIGGFLYGMKANADFHLV